MSDLRVLHDLWDAADRRGRHALGVQSRFPVEGGVCGENRLQLSAQIIVMVAPPVHGLEARVRRQVRPLDRFGNAGPLLVGYGAHEKRTTVVGREGSG
jgi:hypothetical protein